MSLKAELQKWVQALEAYDAQDYSQALGHFEVIADSSRVLFDMGLIHATLGSHKTAVAYYEQAHLLDQYLAVSFFQCGVSRFLMGDHVLAEREFSSAMQHMRGNQIIDYEQLGLKFKLYSAEILSNKGLCLINMRNQGMGMQFLQQARQEKQTDEHNIIDEAIAEGGRDFTVFSVPVGVLFRPPDIKLKNLKAKNYLGNAKLVAATDIADAYIGFSGIGLRNNPANIKAGGGIGPVTAPPRENTAESYFFSGPKPTPPMDDTAVSIQPLNLLRRKSAEDAMAPPARAALQPQASLESLRQIRAPPPSQPLPPQPGMHQRQDSYTRRAQLPRLDTKVRATPSENIGNIVIAPPSPPDSSEDPYAEQYIATDLRRADSSGTTLAYRGGLPQRPSAQREIEYLEELLDGYNEPSGSSPIPPVPQGQSIERVANWAKSQNPKQQQRLAPPTISRKGTLRSTTTGQSGRQGGAPGFAMDFEERGSVYSTRSVDMVSFRIKLHFGEEIRGMSLDADTPHAVFLARLQGKFDLATVPKMRYKDEDGAFITIADASDWDSAIDAAREHCPQGRQDGKLEIWVTD